jgi:hypothetical protein
VHKKTNIAKKPKKFVSFLWLAGMEEKTVVMLDIFLVQIYFFLYENIYKKNLFEIVNTLSVLQYKSL